MKTSTLLIAAGTVGALILLAKSRKTGMGDGDMLLPPPGRTVTASGQVLGGLGLETTYQDAYDATPSQYNRTPQNDFVPGIGASITASPAEVYEGSRLTAGYNPGDRATVGNTVFYVEAAPGGGGFKAILSPGIWRIDQAATNKLRADEAATKTKQEDARQAEIRAIAQAQVNETLAAIQKKAEEDMAAQAKAEAQAAAQAQAAAEPSPEAEPSNYEQAQQAFTVVTQQPPSGNSKVGLLVGGGVLAAIAAAMSTR